MFENASVYAYVPVKDLQRGREFYETVLGFKPASEMEGVGVTYECANNTAFFMYLSEGAGTNKASTLFWVVDDVEAIVGELRRKGVEPVDYNMPDIQTDHGIINTPGGGQAAWIEDPDGNILAINSQ